MPTFLGALEHKDRICELDFFDIQGRDVEDVSAAMRQPFPELTCLMLQLTCGEIPRVISDSFLGGSAPRLQELVLDTIPFPGLPKFLLSASHLVWVHFTPGDGR
jgi:hypothetical protein